MSSCEKMRTARKETVVNTETCKFTYNKMKVMLEQRKNIHTDQAQEQGKNMTYITLKQYKWRVTFNK